MINSTKKEHNLLIASRFLNSMAAACLAGSLVHFFLGIFYYIIKVPEMFIYAIVTCFLFLLWRQLFKNKWLKLPFILGSVNAGIGIFLANYFISWESNFNVYFIILPSALLLYTGWKVWEKLLYMTIIFCLYYISYFTFSGVEGVYNINSEVLKYLSIVNAITAIGILMIILLFFNSSILEMQENLENKNLHLKQKAKELDISLKKVQDRTLELTESEQQLRTLLLKEKELSLLKTSFVSMASHEFRTPLTSIKATSDVILRYFDKLSKDDINKRLEKIKREVEDMTTMLEDILIIGKSNAQKLNYNPELLNIVSLIKNIINEYQLNEFENRSIVYKTPLPVILAQVDKKWIKHIIINLFSNAIKYSDKEKQIEISIKKDQNGISFSFKDYGIGISKQDIKELFTPFHRGKNVQDISGTGLGLSILKKAVELHKGRIEVKSKIGKGSNFKINLPIQK